MTPKEPLIQLFNKQLWGLNFDGATKQLAVLEEW